VLTFRALQVLSTASQLQSLSLRFCEKADVRILNFLSKLPALRRLWVTTGYADDYHFEKFVYYGFPSLIADATCAHTICFIVLAFN